MGQTTLSDGVIKEIRKSADIASIIGEHVHLTEAGRSLKGLCPFHSEKTPSFLVSPDKGFFYCFGCRMQGDVFSFVMALFGISFADAAECLAARTGIGKEPSK
jgi:DNA primase